MAATRASSETRQRNYRVKVATFSVVREPNATWPRCSGPDEVNRITRALIPDDAREHFGMLMLNAQNRVVAWHEVSVGTLNASLVHPREVFGPALRMLGVVAIILVHNHPSGDSTPSAEDCRLTRRLVEAGRLLDVSIHDHLIIGNGTDAYTSMSEKGLL